jgi:hypothetical protein
MPTSEPVSPVLCAMSAASEISGAVWPSPTWQLLRFLGPCFSVNQTSWHSGSGLWNLIKGWHLLGVTEAFWQDAGTRGVLPNLSPSSSSWPGGCVSLRLSDMFIAYGLHWLTETPARGAFFAGELCCEQQTWKKQTPWTPRSSIFNKIFLQICQIFAKFGSLNMQVKNIFKNIIFIAC